MGDTEFVRLFSAQTSCSPLICDTSMLGLLLSQTGLLPQAPPTGYVASVQPSAVVAFRGATSAVPRSALSSTASIFPAQLIADGDVPMSKAKAKIVAAKAEADAKVAARGYTNPEAKESSVKDFIPVKEDSKLSKEQKLIAEADQIGQSALARSSPRGHSHRTAGPPRYPCAALGAREESPRRVDAGRGCGSAHPGARPPEAECYRLWPCRPKRSRRSGSRSPASLPSRARSLRSPSRRSGADGWPQARYSRSACAPVPCPPRAQAELASRRHWRRSVRLAPWVPLGCSVVAVSRQPSALSTAQVAVGLGTTYGYSLYHIRLQPVLHTVTACMTLHRSGRSQPWSTSTRPWRRNSRRR